MNAASNSDAISFSNGITLDIVCDGQAFLGIGNVSYHHTPLRSSKLPWTCYIESESGFRFDEFQLAAVEQNGTEACIVFTSRGKWLPKIQDADAMLDLRVKTRRLTPPIVTFRWCFKAIEEQIAENPWAGLAMRLEIDSPGHPIHWLIEDATWEIGGEAAGCTLIQQDISSIDLEQTVEADSAFSTIECFLTENNEAKTQADTWGGSYPMDMLPRCAGASPLDFQVKSDTAMCLFAEKPSLTRARIQKFADENVIHYTDRPFFPLTEAARPPERKLLVHRHPKLLKRHEWRNLWLDCFTEVRRRIHSNYDFGLEIPRPQLWVFLWNNDLEVYGDKWTLFIRQSLPTYHQLGFHDIFTHGVWDGLSNDFTAAHRNICGVTAFHYAEEFGGAAAMKRLFDEGKRLNIRFWQWFGLYLMSKAPIWKAHPEWILTNAVGNSGEPFTHNGRMRSGFRDYLFEVIKGVKDQTGLDNIFWDSYHNSGVTRVDWMGPDKAPHAEEIWRFQADLQRLGMQHRCESVTIFGITNVAMYGFDGDTKNQWKIRRRHWRNALKNDDVFAWMDCSPGFFSDDPYTAERLSPKHYFWLLAHRAVPVVEARPWGPTYDGKKVPNGPAYLPGKELASQYARVNHLYNAALPLMHRLRLTEGGKYTLWLDERGRPSVIWAFEDVPVKFTGTVREAETGRHIDADGEWVADAGQVYFLSEISKDRPR